MSSYNLRKVKVVKEKADYSKYIRFLLEGCYLASRSLMFGKFLHLVGVNNITQG